jgi:hypothetical protein
MYITDLIPQLSTVSSGQVFRVALKIGVAPAAHRGWGYLNSHPSRGFQIPDSGLHRGDRGGYVCAVQRNRLLLGK